MIVFFFLECRDSRVPVGKHFQGWGLDTPRVQGAVIQAGKQACCIDTDNPVCLCAAERRRKERVIIPPVFEVIKTAADSCVLH